MPIQAPEVKSLATATQTLGPVEVEVHRIGVGSSWEIALTRVPPTHSGQGAPAPAARGSAANQPTADSARQAEEPARQTVEGPPPQYASSRLPAERASCPGARGAPPLEVAGSPPHATPVLLVHGNFSNRGFWVSPRGIGLAPFLAGRGYDVWIVELRGHGLSPKGPDFSFVTAEDHIQGDLSAAVRYVNEATGKPIFLAGHSAGGIFVASYVSVSCLKPDQFLGIALFGAQMAGGERFLKVPPLAFLSEALLKLLGEVPARLLGLGPESEPAGEMLEFIRWKKRGGRWEDSRGFSYRDGLKAVETPVLAVAGAADRNDAPAGCRELMEDFGGRDKRFVLLARGEGFSRDYDHIGMIVSKEAAREVWPLLADWMDERRPG